MQEHLVKKQLPKEMERILKNYSEKYMSPSSSGLASEKQINFLVNNKIKHSHSITKREASALISAFLKADKFLKRVRKL